MSRTVLVTGAAGFIGSHVVAALLRGGRPVVGLDNFDPFYDRGLKERNLAACGDTLAFVEADIGDAVRLDALFSQHRPDLVVHIAALAGVRPSLETPARYVRVNVDGLVSVMECARKHGCQDFVFASSSSVYGNRDSGPFCETDDVSRPISPYAASKRAAELMCHAWTHLYDMRCAILRFFTVFGPAQRPDLAISKFMRLIAEGAPVPRFGDGRSSRDYTYIDDIVSGVLAAVDLVERAPDGFCRTFNLGGSSPVSLSEMIECIGRVAGVTPMIEEHPMQPGDVVTTFADLTRSRAELGYDPKTPFEEGIARQWEWMKGSEYS